MYADCVPIRGLVFDLYGTLVTKGSGWRAYRELIRSLAPWQWRSARHAALTEAIPSISQIHARFNPRRGRPAEELEALVAQGISEVELYPDTISTLERARSQGLRLALLSNLASPYKQPVFDLGLDSLFDELVFSCDVGLAKPDPKIFTLVSDKLGLPPEQLLMIGDSRHDDIRGAKRVGMPAVQIDHEGKRGDIHCLDEVFEHGI